MTRVPQTRTATGAPPLAMALGRACRARCAGWLRKFDPGFRWAKEEIRKRDQRIGELQRELAAGRAAIEIAVPGNSPACWGLSSEQLGVLGDKGVFIVGNARSGTAILCDCFNLSPEIFLLGEANVYLHHRRDDFAAKFNRQHEDVRNRRGKGTYLPPAIAAESGGMAALWRMGRFHRYVGEKIAFGPHGTVGGQSHQELFFAFHARYFYASKYFLTLRAPAECIWSMAKMFPQKDPRELYESWLNTLKIQLDLLHAFPNAYLILFENLRTENLCDDRRPAGHADRRCARASCATITSVPRSPTTACLPSFPRIST